VGTRTSQWEGPGCIKRSSASGAEGGGVVVWEAGGTSHVRSVVMETVSSF
jgi:hypothetical protein